MINRYLRIHLRNVLGFLTKKTIDKHNIDIILVVGWAGSSIVRELTYHILASHINVRRNTKEIWWDFSVPLCILGYKDRKRNVFEWMSLLVKSASLLLIAKPYPHSIIINLDTYDKDIAKFWASYLKVDILVLLKVRPKSILIGELLSKDESRIIYNQNFFNQKIKDNSKRFSYGGKDALVQYKRKGDILELVYKGKKERVSIPDHFSILWEYIPPSVSVGLIKNIPLSILVQDLSTFTFHPKQLQNGLSQLKEFLHRSNGKK